MSEGAKESPLRSVVTGVKKVRLRSGGPRSAYVRDPRPIVSHVLLDVGDDAIGFGLDAGPADPQSWLTDLGYLLYYRLWRTHIAIGCLKILRHRQPPHFHVLLALTNQWTLHGVFRSNVMMPCREQTSPHGINDDAYNRWLVPQWLCIVES